MAIEEQVQYNATHIIGPPPAWPGQVGQCLIVPGRSITKLGFWLSKYRFPTGGISFAIYRASDGALLGSKLWGDAAALPATLDPADLVADAIYYEVTLAAPVDVDEEVYIVVDYTSTFHDATNNLWVMVTTSNVKADECLISRIGIWNPTPDRDCAYRYTYTVVPPTVTTQAVSDIEEITATSPGEITDIGGQNCDKRGVCWKTTPGPTVADSKSEEIGSFGTGAFTRSMTGLAPGTKYYVKAYAHNSAGYGYGSEVTFTTKPQVATGFSAIAIDENQIDVSWTAGAGATKTMVRRKVGSYPTSLSDGDQAYFDIGNSFSDLGLTPGTHYFYRAWSWVEGSDIWSDDYAEDDAATPLAPPVPPPPPPPPEAVPEYQKRALVVSGIDVDLDNPLPVDTSPGNKTPLTVLDEAAIVGGATTPFGDCVNIDLAHGPDTLALTIEALYNGAATAGIRIHIRTSYTDLASGLHTGGMGVALLTDANAHFGNVNELIGLTVHNVTDGSTGNITANTLTTITAALAGGIDNLWDTDDEYFIVGAIFDTEDFDVWNPAFAAGAFIRETKVYEVDPFEMKVLVENLDAVNAVGDVLVVATIGA